MVFSFTGIAYLTTFFFFMFLTYRFYQQWQRDGSLVSRLFFYNGFLFNLFFLITALGVLFFAQSSQILKSVVVSAILFQSLSLAVIGYLVIYMKFSRLSPWVGFLILASLGVANLILAIVTSFHPFLQKNGVVNWDLPPLTDILRSFSFLLAMVPLNIILFKQSLKIADKNSKIKAAGLFLIYFSGFMIAILEFIVEAYFNFGAISSDISVLVFGTTIFFVVFFTQKPLRLATIRKIKAKDIIDSNRLPTVEVSLETDFGKFSASVPSGISAGKYEAKTVHVDEAIKNIERSIASAIGKENLGNQKRIDEILKRLEVGANAALPVSIAVCRAGAKLKKLPLYQYIAELAENSSQLFLPKPSFNMIEGGKHAKSDLRFQEFMVVPQETNFGENFEAGRDIYSKLRNVLTEKFKKIELSAEGAFLGPTGNIAEVLNFILEAARGRNFKIAIDVAASSFAEKIDIGTYKNLVDNFPIISLEDPFGEDDFEAFAGLKKEMGDKVLIFGDDLTVSNVERMKIAKEKDAIGALILKPNQIGTVTETLEAAKLAKSYGWKIMVSNRAGETEDDFIADLAVGIGADFIKSGAPFPKERMAKYNRLAKIEKELWRN